MSRNRLARIGKLFIMMVVFTLCVIGYFGNNLPLMIVGLFTGYLVLSFVLTGKKGSDVLDD